MASISLGRFAVDSFEGVAERALGRIAQRAGDHRYRCDFLSQRAFGKLHAPFSEIGEWRDACSRSEVESERGSRHRACLGELVEMPGAGGIRMHQAQGGSDAGIAQRSQPSRWHWAGRL